MNVTIATEIDTLIEQIRAASWKERETLGEQLRDLLVRLGDEPGVEGHLDELKKKLPLEIRWEIDAILEGLAPEPEPEEEESEEEAEEEVDPNAPLTSKDLVLVYDDPRGLLLHKTKKGNRWFATQRDPNTGQPMTFELSPPEVEKLKSQLSGTPYWVVGSGASTP